MDRLRNTPIHLCRLRYRGMRNIGGSPSLPTAASTSAAISTAVPDNSPSPCRACTSPIHNKPPVTDTGKYTRAPTAMTLWSRLPPHRAGLPQLIGSPLRDQRGYLTPPERQFVRRPGGPWLRGCVEGASHRLARHYRRCYRLVQVHLVAPAG